MNRPTSKIVTITAIIGLVAGLTGCCNLIWTSKCPPKIAEQPQSLVAKEHDREVSFSVVVSQPKEVSYQWQFNGSNILKATEATYKIAHPVEFSNVGEYRVLVKSGNGVTTSQPAYLSIYALTTKANVNTGTLSTPIGQFGSQTYSCNGGTFQKGYTPVDAAGLPMFFYGPKATPQSGIFKNIGTTSSTPGSTLVIDTFSIDNGTADTGIRIQNNWTPFANADCNDNAPANSPGATDPKQSQCQIALSQNPGGVSQKNTYRLSVLYKVPPGAPTSGKVTFNWCYK